MVALACEAGIRSLNESGCQPLLSVNNAIQSTEVIFATYHISLLRGRVDLPLQYEENALLDMLEQNEIGQNRQEGN